ncbi:MAG: hypothetical protein KR126chlam6_00461 [Candidatus Anoxychlamydiales bacterium]|nr:hypothetical protein [Candidatus Anoxychlamydiales bacterium]
MSLENLREEIDEIDDQIIDLLERRLNIAKDLIKYKKNVTDITRENEILAKIESEYIKNIYKTIFENSKKVQRKNL